MIVAGHLTFDQFGRVLCKRVAPLYLGHTPTRDGLLCFEDNLNPVYFVDELGYGADGRICVQALPASLAGDKSLRVATTEPIVSYWLGLPFTADGRLAVNEISDELPGGGNPGAFARASYSTAFDIGSP